MKKYFRLKLNEENGSKIILIEVQKEGKLLTGFQVNREAERLIRKDAYIFWLLSEKDIEKKTVVIINNKYGLLEPIKENFQALKGGE